MVKETSGRNILRMDKREMILACLIVRGTLDQTGNITNMILNSNKPDLLQWMRDKVMSTDWIRDSRQISGERVLFVDSNKLRIYNKWTGYAHVPSVKKILKYMHSPLLAALFIMSMDGNTCYVCGDKVFIYLNKPVISNAEPLAVWFEKVLGIDCQSVMGNDIDSLMFPIDEFYKLLSLVRPIIEELPIIYKEIYELEAWRNWQI